MKIIPLYSTLLFLSGFICLSLPSARATTVNIVHIVSTDSLRIEKKDGKRFIVHRVDEGQTLYAISRKYKRSVAEIKAANPDMKDAVRYDQLVLIPVPDGLLTRKEEKAIDKAIKKQAKEAKREAREREKETEKIAETKPAPKAEKAPEKEVKKSDDPAQSGIHVVEAGQTLYSLANRYGVSQADIRKWNNLPGNNVLIGQPLIVSERAYLDRTPSNSIASTKSADAPSRPAPAHTVDTNTSEPRPHETRPTPHTEPKSDHRNEADTPTRPSASGTKPAEPEPEPPRPGNDAPMPTQGRRISSSGVAEMIEGTDGSGKYLALHRTAPIGTLVQVRNEFNNQSLWVKVIGRLPNTGINDKILIKLSSQAFSKLSPEDRRFRAEVSYIVR
ncbi:MULTISPECIES: LysM peptidoglycan-binding domain-containing protein [unclassified Spirosoma]|uniref:LysM peptidoglycan-binding domain-containing protein n=1 Tax=unclassified Spirosoma TaxID=2621999 RepID=UPI00095BC64D|nr:MULTISPECIES: LysM peptidoglycan-binding domain-containing protein [unclassified Spirosoma]MBN8826081.1 LysM peptidoglycan-binding domain-containing protein [Spirosoma sp.]OJW75532.1 MAG: peptidoglycan-binding protein [Spirosoma sp. 48-14]